MTEKFVTLPRSVVEQALEALTCTGEHDDPGHRCTHCDDYVDRNGPARAALRAALGQPQGEQEAAPNGATHIQLQQGAFYKRVDGKWYVWSLMKNGEPHRWYISPGTAESCLEPLATTPKQKREPLTDEQIWELYCDWHEKPGGCYGFARAIETHHGIK